jgi:hypothetical protein
MAIPDVIGTIQKIFRIGLSTSSGASILRFSNSSGNLDLQGNPTENRVVIIPNNSGTLALLSDVGNKPTTVIQYATNITIPITGGDSSFSITFTGNANLSIYDGAFDGQIIRISLIQGSGGEKLVTLSNKFRFSDSAPANSFILSTTAGKKDVFTCSWDTVASKWDVLAFMRGF